MPPFLLPLLPTPPRRPHPDEDLQHAQEQPVKYGDVLDVSGELA